MCVSENTKPHIFMTEKYSLVRLTELNWKRKSKHGFEKNIAKVQKR